MESHTVLFSKNIFVCNKILKWISNKYHQEASIGRVKANIQATADHRVWSAIHKRMNDTVEEICMTFDKSAHYSK